MNNEESLVGGSGQAPQKDVGHFLSLKVRETCTRVRKFCFVLFFPFRLEIRVAVKKLCVCVSACVLGWGEQGDASKG